MKISVATPVFNGLPYLRSCIASVTDQATDTLAVEHLVHDGGSSDSSLELLRKSPAVSWESAADEGMYDAINRCWQRSTGDILCYLNADEQYLPGALQLVARYFQEHPDTDLLFGDALVVDAAMHPIAYRRVVKPSALYIQTVHLTTLSCAMFFRRSWFDQGLRFDSQWKAIGDAVWVAAMLRAGASAGIMHRALAAFTMTGNNLGATTGALAEAAQWRSAAPAWARRLSRAWKVQFYLQKLLAGAYRRRDIRTALYSPLSGDTRAEVRNPTTGFQWPDARSPVHI